MGSVTVRAPRRWSVVLHRHEDASYTARVWVDGKLLRPDCVGCTDAAALAYAAEALVDARPEDQLALRTQGAGAIRTWDAADAISATRWLAERMQAMAVATCSDDMYSDANSGTRPIVPPAEEPVAAAAHSRG
jgi:hypothetical protein